MAIPSSLSANRSLANAMTVRASGLSESAISSRARSWVSFSSYASEPIMPTPSAMAPDWRVPNSSPGPRSSMSF